MLHIVWTNIHDSNKLQCNRFNVDDYDYGDVFEAIKRFESADIETHYVIDWDKALSNEL